jgi:thioesterase domain-containing protein
MRAACADAVKIVPIGLPDWPVLASRRFDIPTLLGYLATQVEKHAETEPIKLLGNCLGGMLAYAVAGRLDAAGHEVGFVGIINADVTWARSPTPPPTFLKGLRSLYWAWHRGHLIDDVATVAAREIASRPRLLRWLAARGRMRRFPSVARLHLNRRLQMSVPSRIDRDGLARMLDEGDPLAAPVVLFRSDEHAPSAPNDLHWAPLCARLTVVSIGGDHDVFRADRLPSTRAAFVESLRDALRTGETEVGELREAG